MLRKFRQAIAILIFASLTLFFLDFTEKIPIEWGRLAKIQFVPALLRVPHTILAGGIVLGILLLLPFLFGRVYCSFICPLGIFQDIVSRIGKIGRKKKRYAYAPPKRKMRLFFFAVMAAALVLGHIGIAAFSLISSLLDPYGIYGRFMSQIFSPLYRMGNNLLASIAPEQFYFVPVEIACWETFAVAIVFFVLLVYLAGRYGRIYCNAVCPVGTLLGGMSKASLLKIRWDKKKCVGCKRCEGVCKSGCLDASNKTTDASRCVVCFDCLNVCRQGALSFSLPKRETPDDSSSSELQTQQKTDSSAAFDSPNKKDASPSLAEKVDLEKRQILKGTLLAVAAASVPSATASLIQGAEKESEKETTALKISEMGKTPYKIAHAVSPPGSKGFERLAAHCSACHLCVNQCPTNVLKPAFLDYGLSGFMLPVLKFSPEVYCNFDCVRCGEVCPNGAILPLTPEQKHQTQLGRVEFIEANCVVKTEETQCGACSEHCPTQAVKMVPYKGNLTIPETHPEFCVGCGACESICPVIPYKAIHVEGHLVHETAEKPPEAEKIDVKLDDFGF